MTKLITCLCGEKWEVQGERKPWSNKFTVARALLICRKCGAYCGKQQKRKDRTV